MEILTRKQALEICKDTSEWITKMALIMHAKHLVTMEMLKDINDTQNNLKSVETAISLNFGEGR